MLLPALCFALVLHKKTFLGKDRKLRKCVNMLYSERQLRAFGLSAGCRRLGGKMLLIFFLRYRMGNVSL